MFSSLLPSLPAHSRRLARAGWLFAGLLLCHPDLALASPGCQAVNGHSGTLQPLDVVSLLDNSQQVNAGDSVTFTTSGSSSDGLVQYLGSFILIDNNGSGTVVNSATESGSGAAGDGIQYASGSGTVSYSIACVSVAPTLSAIVVPGTPTPGSTITLSGSAFYGATSVNFNGVASTAFSVGGANQMTATIPAVTGTVTVDVTTDAGTSSSIVIPVTAPTITLAPTTLPEGTLGSPYSQTFTASGGGGSYLYIASGLPTGLTMSSAGVLAGTPTVTGSFAIVVTATDANGYTGNRSYTLLISAAPPGAPTAVSASAGNATVAVSFSAPGDTGGSAITGYTVTSSPGGITATGTASPITVSGLSNGVAYTFTVTASNAAGTGTASSASSAVTPQADAQAITGFSATPAAPVYRDGGTFTLAATGGGSSSPVVFASTTPTICSVDASTVTMLASGTCSLTANQAGDASHSAADAIVLDVTIAAAVTTLDWLPSLSKTLGEAAFVLQAPSSASTGAFTYTSSNPAVASVAGATVTLVGAGSTTLTVTQAAAGNYAAASASTTLTVSARPDPSQDASVVDGLQAQVDASLQFAAAQQDNIGGRLRQLRNGGGTGGNGLSLAVGGNHGQGGGSVPLAAGPGGAPGMLGGWTGWSAGTLSLGQRDAGGGGRGFDLDSRGITVGLDRTFGAAALGIAVGAGRSSGDFSDTRSDLDARQRSLSLYGLWRAGEHLYLDGLLGWGRLDFDIVRWSDSADAAATASRDGEQAFASLELGYRQPIGRGALTGYARYDASRSRLDAYREYGLDLYDLAYARQQVDSDTLAVGVEGSHALAWGGRALRPFWLLEYRDSLRGSADARVDYVVAPSADGYAVTLRRYVEDSWALGLGSDVELAAGWSLSLQVRRETSASGVDDTVFGLRLSRAAMPVAPPVSSPAR